MLTIAKTMTSSATVVSASFERSPVMIRPAARMVVNATAAHGVRRFGSTRLELRRQDALARHPVEQPRGHDHVDQRAVGERQQPDRGEDLLVDPERALLDDLEQRPARAREVVRRHDGRGADGDEEVEDAGDRQPAEQDLRIGAARLLGLLGDVDRVLEADQRIERERGAGEHRGEHARALLELERAARLGVALDDRDGGDQDDQQQPADLDDREADVELHRLRDPA